jgi:D-glycero-D-manno-heptose 1,7-bisphosphate phosphatase
VNKYVIFDRDGTLIEHIHYLKDPNLVKLKPGTAAGMQLLLINKFRFGVITNQSIINRNLATEQEVIDTNNKVRDICGDFRAKFDFIYYCPHIPEENCNCRKPKTALGIQALTKFNIDIKKSFYVGDQKSDIEFARNLGLTPILINHMKSGNFGEDYLEFSDIFEASLYITNTNFSKS